MIRTVIRAILGRTTTAAVTALERVHRPAGDQPPVAAALIAALIGVLVFILAVTVFPYHSSNHDEAVYLMQATMLLEGQLELHADGLAGAVKPWFFIEDGGRLYPKYSPVPAAMFAGTLAVFGEPRVTLGIVAAVNTGLVYTLGAMAFTRRVGVLAALLFGAAPLTLMSSSVFLPYAPTTALNLVFAVGYLRGVRDQSTLAAGTAGVAIGLAFFARPYTAVLFATPFIGHALSQMVTVARDNRLRQLPEPIRRHGVTAVVGLLFVGLTLAYNLRMTGSALLFPYEAFAPADGPGFGRRRLLSHSVEYTPEVAVRANAHLLWYFATRWFTAGPLGSALAGVGLAAAIRQWHPNITTKHRAVDTSSIGRLTGCLLAGLFVTVTVGNLFFWGNYNVLATISDPTDGFIAKFGPVYHFDLLAPVSVFGAVGLVTCRQALSRCNTVLNRRTSQRTANATIVIALVVSVVIVSVGSAAVVAQPLERNIAYTDKYETAYDPIETASFDDALVFIPTPYGEWQGHPFQSLRNDPGFDGAAVYALDRSVGENFATLDEYPDRTLYRYTYHGEWTPDATQHVKPKLEPVTTKRGSTLAFNSTVGVPSRVDHARVRLETETSDSSARYTVEDPDDSLAVAWSADTETVNLRGASGDGSVSFDGVETIVLLVTLVQPDGGTLTYRQEMAIRTVTDTDATAVEVLWPPDRYVCTLVTDCGTEGTYLPGEPETHREGVEFDTRIETRDQSAI